ncbi:MAG: hypothetical protein AAFV53_27355, partial [Myxococcota bacterium]
MRPILLFPMIALLACDSRSDDGQNNHDNHDDDSQVDDDEDVNGGEDVGYLGDAPAEDDAAFSPEEVAAAIEAALDQAMSLNAEPIVSIYEEMMAGADAGCPQWTENDGNPLWLDTCTASSGTRFEGYGLYFPLNNLPDGTGNVWNGVQLFSVANMTTPGGDVLTLGGEAGQLVGTNAAAGYQVFNTYMADGYQWDGANTQSWLDLGISPQLSLFAYRYDNGSTVTQLSALIELEDGPIQAVVLDDLYILDTPGDIYCEAEPSGTISLLDADGRWYDLIFDGPAQGQLDVPEESCDGCATTWYRGTSLGDACADFSAL